MYPETFLSIAFSLPDPEHSPLTRYVLVTGYLTAALCWFKAGLRARGSHNKSSRRWWMMGALLFFSLATNKACDWRSQCEMYIRMIANAGGWYEQREPVQFFFAIILPIAAGLFILALLWIKARPFVRNHPFAFSRLVLAVPLTSPCVRPRNGNQPSLGLNQSDTISGDWY